MNPMEAYEYAREAGKAGLLMRLYSSLLLRGKSEAEALRIAMSKAGEVQPSLSPSAKAMYRLQYRRAVKRGEDESSARKDALLSALNVMKGQS